MVFPFRLLGLVKAGVSWSAPVQDDADDDDDDHDDEEEEEEDEEEENNIDLLSV